MSDFVYQIFNTTHMAILAFTVTFLNYFLFATQTYKRWNKFIKSSNWLLLAVVYLYDAMFNPPISEYRVWFRLSLALLFIGEIAYHGDAIWDLGHWVKGKILRE